MADKIPEGTADATPMSKTKRKQTIWPDPMVVNPTTPHTHSIILLHGRGSNAEGFGLELLKSRASDGKTLIESFPGAKFIFPTSKKRRSAIFKRIPINQWFDNYSLEDTSKRQYLQYDGIQDTTAFVHGLIRNEASVVGASHVVIGGLSQGCAAALQILLNFRPEEDVRMEASPLAGFVGMSGWLPFAEMLDPRAGGEKKLQDGVGIEEDDMFGFDEEDDCDGNGKGDEDIAERSASLEQLQLRAANTARDIASLLPLSAKLEDAPVFPRTPIFLGHGRNDDRVPVELGEQARDIFEALGCRVQWKDYDEGHWYKVPEEIDDIVGFLRSVVGMGSEM